MPRVSQFPHVACDADFSQAPLTGTFSPVVLADRPYSYYRFNETGGTALGDASGNGRTGAYVGAWTLQQTGRLAEAANAAARANPLGADTRYATVLTPTFMGVVPVTVGWSAFVLAKLGAFPAAGQVLHLLGGPTGSGGSIDVRVNETGVVAFVVPGASGTPTWSALSLGVFYLIHVVREADPAGVNQRLSLYINGTLASNTAYGTLTQGVFGPSRVGDTEAATPADSADAHVDEAAFYDYALSPGQIAVQAAAMDVASPAAGVWTPISSKVRSFSLSRGRQDELGKADPGELPLELDGSDRRFEMGFAGVLANDLANPSFETDMNGWSAAGVVASVTRDSARAWAGGWSAKAVASAAGNLETYTNWAVTGDRAAQGAAYAASIWVYAEGAAVGRTAELAFWELGGASPAASSSVSKTLVAGWQRLEVARVLASTGRTNLQLSAYFFAGAAGEYVYADAAMVSFQTLTASDPYIDGSFDNGRWEGTPHASRSLRGGPYYPNVLPNRKIRLRATWPPNLALDGSFEQAALGVNWVGSGGGSGFPVRSAITTIHGSWLVQASADGGSNDTGSVLSNEPIPVDTAQPYTLSAHMHKNAAVTPGLILRLVCYDRHGTLLGYGYPTVASTDGTVIQVSGFGFDLPGANAWYRVGGTIRPGDFPRGTAQVRIEVWLLTGPASAVVTSLDAVELRPGPAATAGVEPAGDPNNPFNNVNYAYGQRYDLFTGHNERWQPAYGIRRGVAAVPCYDRMAMLATAEATGSRPAELTSARLGALLDAAGVPAGERELDTGAETMLPEAFTDEQALTKVRLVEDSEDGLFFFDGRGFAILHSRDRRTTNSRSTVSQATFAAAPVTGTDLPFARVTVEDDIQRVRNIIRVTRPDVPDRAAANAASRNQYGPRPLEVTTLLSSDSAQQAAADRRLARLKDAKRVVRSIVVNPHTDDRLWPQVLGRQIGDRITVKEMPLRVPPAIISDYWIEKISHDVTIGGAGQQQRRRWRTEWFLSPVS